MNEFLPGEKSGLAEAWVMGAFEELKKIWKKLGFKGHVKNFSSKPLWVLETDTGKPIAHLLPPMAKSPPKVDADAFRRTDGKPIEGHSSWWKIYDVNADVFDNGKGGLRVSSIARTAVKDDEFEKGAPGSTVYDKAAWGVPIRLVTDIRRDKKKRIVAYPVSGVGWLDTGEMLTLTCHHEVDNARPVFPKGGKPFIRTRRDQEWVNNLETMGLA